MKKILPLILAFIMLTPSFAQKQGQEKIDSLLAELPDMKLDTNKVRTLAVISLAYNVSDPDKGIEFGKKSLKLAKDIGWKSGIIGALNAIATNYLFLSKYDMATEYFDKALKIAKTTDNTWWKAQLYGNMSMLYYNISNFDKAIKYSKKSIEMKKILGDERGLAISSVNLANVYKDQNKFDEAMKLYKKSLKIGKSLNDKQIISTIFLNIGQIYDAKSDFDEAIDYFHKAMKVFEEIDDLDGVVLADLSIGIIYKNKNDNAKALEYFEHALPITRKMGNVQNEAYILNSIGLINLEKLNYDEAMESFKNLLEVALEINDNNALLVAYENMGIVHIKKENYYKAIELLEKSLHLAESYNSENDMAVSLGSLGLAYYSISQDSINMERKEYQNISSNTRKNYLLKAIDYLEKSVALFIKVGDLLNTKTYSKLLSDAYAANDKYQKALETYKKHITIKDSIFNEETQTKIANLEAKRENELKAKEIERLEKENEYQQSRSYYLYALSALIFVVLVVMFLFYRNKRKSNRWLAAKNKVIKEANIELETLNNDLADKNRQISLANTELEELNNDLADKNHTISEAHQKITDSINYAEKIQMAMLPFPERMNEIFKEHFVLYKPKDVVSGDFYWVEQSGGFTFAAVVDCTGHGVPGAFMSIIGYDLLNQIVLVDKIFEPRDILYRLNELVRKALHQKDEIGSQQDGMELSIIRIKGDELVFAGARRPLWYSTNGKIEEIKGNKFGIGGRVRKERVFTQQSMKLTGETKLFMFSDGIIDQNNEKDDLFGKARLKGILESSMELQSVSAKLNEEFDEFAANTERRDDITVFGFKL